MINDMKKYVTEKELNRFKLFVMEFIKEHSYISALNVAKIYREKYMSEIHNDHVLKSEVERSLTWRASKFLSKGRVNGYLKKYSQRAYEIDHKKLKKHIKKNGTTVKNSSG